MNGTNGAAAERRRLEDRWHVGKEVPIVLILAVIAQTAGGVWWMAQMSSKLDGAVSTIAEIKNERYTREDARRDTQLLDARFQTQQNVDREQERRMLNLESRVDRMEQRGKP